MIDIVMVDNSLTCESIWHCAALLHWMHPGVCSRSMELLCMAVWTLANEKSFGEHSCNLLLVGMCVACKIAQDCYCNLEDSFECCACRSFMGIMDIE